MLLLIYATQYFDYPPYVENDSERQRLEWLLKEDDDWLILHITGQYW